MILKYYSVEYIFYTNSYARWLRWPLFARWWLGMLGRHCTIPGRRMGWPVLGGWAHTKFASSMRSWPKTKHLQKEQRFPHLCTSAQSFCNTITLLRLIFCRRRPRTHRSTWITAWEWMNWYCYICNNWTNINRSTQLSPFHVGVRPLCWQWPRTRKSRALCVYTACP